MGDKEKGPGIITAQIELVEMYVWAATAYVREAQQRALFKPCKLGKVDGCLACKAKQWILRKRYP